MSNTQYNVVMAGEVVDTRSKKESAVSRAAAVADENPSQLVQVQTATGNVVHEIQPTKAGTHFRPWTRTETHDGLEIEVPAGYTVAYVRRRIGAAVARANDKAGWMVITADKQYPAKNTKEAREITNELAKERKAKREQEAKEAADAKAKAKAEKASTSEAADAA